MEKSNSSNLTPVSQLLSPNTSQALYTPFSNHLRKFKTQLLRKFLTMKSKGNTQCKRSQVQVIRQDIKDKSLSPRPRAEYTVTHSPTQGNGKLRLFRKKRLSGKWRNFILARRSLLVGVMLWKSFLVDLRELRLEYKRSLSCILPPVSWKPTAQFRPETWFSLQSQFQRRNRAIKA